MPIPLSPPDTSESGAVTYPRQLQRWLDVNRVTKLDRISTFITIPAFASNSDFDQVSDVIFAFNVESPNNISLKNWLVPSSPNYAMCVSYRVGNVVTRYLLWDAEGSALNQQLEQYTGQLLLKNFRFEVWNTAQGAISEVNVNTFYTSKLGNVDYRYGTNGPLVASDAVTTDFENINATLEIASNPNLFTHWISSSGFTVDGSNLVTSWDDVIDNFELLPTGSVGGLVIPTITQLSMAPLTNGFMQSALFGIGVDFCLSVMFPLLLTSTGTSGIIFNNGNGVVFGFDSGTGKFTSFINGSSAITPVISKWYLIALTPSTGETKIYELESGILVDIFVASTATGDSTQYTFGNLPCAIPEIATWNVELTDSEFNNAVGYFIQTYYTAMSLPLTFPTNAVSVEN